MRAIVTELFLDKVDGSAHPVGEIVDFDDERVKDLSERKLVDILEEEKKPARRRKS